MKDKGSGRNCEPNIHFESFYPSEVINEEGLAGTDSGPAIASSIAGEQSVKMEARDGVLEQAEISRKSSSKIGGQEATNYDAAESMKNLKSRPGAMTAQAGASENSAGPAQRMADTEHHEVTGTTSSVITKNINFFRQEPRSQSFKQSSARPEQVAGRFSVAKTSHPYAQVRSVTSG